MKWAKGNTLIVAAFAIASAIFVADVVTPAGTGVWAFYFIAVLLTYQSSNTKAPLFLAGVCTTLIIVDFISGSPRPVPLPVLINRAIGISLLWITAAALTHHRRREEVLREALDLNRQVAGSSLLGILIYDAGGGQCVLANEAAARSIGSSLEGLLAQNFRTIQSWKPSGLLEAAESVLATGENRRMSCQLHTSFGNDIWIDCFLAKIQTVHRPHLLLMFENITERKRAEEALTRSEERYRDLFESAPVGYHEIDVEGRITKVNQTEPEMLGYAREEMI